MVAPRVLPASSPRLCAIAFFALIVPFAIAKASSIIGGTDVNAGDFPEVFALTYANPNDGNLTEICTATLIHPQILLTSGHCVPANSKPPLEVRAGNSLRAPIAFHPVKTFLRHPSFAESLDPYVQTRFDFAVVILESPILGIKPVTILNYENSRAAELQVVGYGGHTQTVADGSTGTKREATTQIIETGNGYFVTRGPRSALSYGDSGGPAFVADSKGIRKLVGVASGVPEDLMDVHTGASSESLYAGIRPEIAQWIEKTSGFALTASEF